MAKVRSSRGPRKRLPLLRSLFSLLFSLLLGGVLLGAAGLGLYMLYLDGVIRTEFDRKRWALPAKVYARPLELFAGMPLSADAFAQELKLLGYRDVNCPVEPATPPEPGKRTIRRKPKLPTPEACVPPPGGGNSPDKPGGYARRGEVFEVMTRDFAFWDGAEPARKVRLTFAGNILVDVVGLDGQEAPGLLRLDPPRSPAFIPPITRIASCSTARNCHRRWWIPCWRSRTARISSTPASIPRASSAPWWSTCAPGGRSGRQHADATVGEKSVSKQRAFDQAQGRRSPDGDPDRRSLRQGRDSGSL